MSTATPGRWQRLGDRIDAMSLRERGMLFLIGLLLLGAAWNGMLMAPLNAERRASAVQVEQLSTQVTSMNEAVQALVSELARDPQADARLRLEALAAQDAQADRALQQATGSLVDPRDMGAVLEAILARQQGLRLLGLQALAPEPIDLGSDTGVAPLFRHGMTIEVDGRYADLLRFLHAVEALPWGFIWRELEIEHDTPRNRMRLTLYTMSLQEGWLGV